MKKIIRYTLLLILWLFAVTACAPAFTESARPTSTNPAPASTLAPTATLTPVAQATFTTPSSKTSHFDEEGFNAAVSEAIKQQTMMPDFATLEIAPLFYNEATYAFKGNQELVLQLNVFGYPDPKKSQELVAPLINTTAMIAEEHQVPLSGLEIVFHRRHEINPMLVWASTPPWGEEQRFSVPLSSEK